jgi:hypothetical protein
MSPIVAIAIVAGAIERVQRQTKGISPVGRRVLHEGIEIKSTLFLKRIPTEPSPSGRLVIPVTMINQTGIRLRRAHGEAQRLRVGSRPL